MTSVMLGTTRRGSEFVKQIAALQAVTKGFELCLETVRILDGGNGKCSAEFIVAEEHLNNDRTLHNGFTATIVDMISTYALMSKPCTAGLSVNLNVNYLKSAKEGDVIQVNAETIRAGKNLAFLECELLNKTNGVIIARGNQTKFVDFGKKEVKTE